MLTTRAHLRRTGRIAILSTALGLALATGLAGTASAGSGGANGQCPGGAYCSTRDGSASMNGNGNGKATGKPCAGCVGNADNKNPKGQRPNGSDHNAGYECDSNHGIGRTNPAHTGCKPAETPPKHEKCKHDRDRHDRDRHDRDRHKTHKHSTPAVVTPAVVVSPAEAVAPAVASVVVSPAEAAVNPLPTAAAAGQADTSGQLTAGGLAGFAAFLALGAGSVLRRRRVEI